MLHGSHGHPTLRTRLRRLADPLKKSLSLLLMAALLAGDASIPWRSASAYQAAPSSLQEPGERGPGQDRPSPQMSETNLRPEEYVQPASPMAEAVEPGPSAPVANPPAVDPIRKHQFGTTTRNSDGSYTTRLSTRPVHWRDADSGEWKDFDNTIREIPSERARPGFSHENAANGFRASFARPDHAAAGGPLVHFSQGDAAVSMALAGARPGGAQVQDAQISYHGAFSGVSVRYTVDGDVLKEDIVLQTPAAVRALSERTEGLSFTFELTLEGVTAERQPDGSVSFLDESGKVRFKIPRPFMVDGGRGPARRSNEVQVALADRGGGAVRLELRPDLAWLLEAGRAYPVAIDPSFVTLFSQPDDAVAKDTYVMEGTPDLNWGSDTDLWVGPFWGDSHTLLQFDDLDTLTGLSQDTIISSAMLGVQTEGMGSATFPIEVHRIAAAWNESSVTWNTAPAIDPLVEASVITTPAEEWNTFDVTALVRRWVSGEVPNDGFMLLAPAPQVGFQIFYSSNTSFGSQLRPYLQVTYIVATRYGIDRHWTYGPVQEYGDGTSSRVNITTGNLVVQHTDSVIAARGFDVRLAHTYNSQDPYGSTSDGGPQQGRHFGTGWTFSQNLRISEFDNGNGALLKDGDGTWRTYYKETEQAGIRSYRRPLYYDYSLTKNLNNPPADRVYTLTAEKGLNKYYFAADGTLRRIEDRNGNFLSYGYDSYGRLTTITDVAGRAVTLVYNGPGAPGRLSQIADMAGRISTYGYDAAGNLTTIRHGVGTPDQVTTTFGYDAAGQMVSVTNPRGHAGLVGYSAQGSWESGTFEGWGLGVGGCRGGSAAVGPSTTQFFMGGWSLQVDLVNSPCGSVQKAFATPSPLDSTRQELVGYAYVPAGAPSLTASLYVQNQSGARMYGPSVTLIAGVWNRMSWREAPVDPTFPVGVLGVRFAPSAGYYYTGSVWLDQVFVRGQTVSQKDTLAVHNTVAQYSYDPANKRTTMGQPDQTGALQNTVYSYSGYGWVTQITDPLGYRTSYAYDTSGRLTSETPPPLESGATGSTAATFWDTAAGQPTNFLKTAQDPTGATSRHGVDLANGDRRYTITPNQEDLRQQGQPFTATIYVRDSAGNLTGEQTNLYVPGANLDQVPFPAPWQTHRTRSYTYYSGAGGLVAGVTDPNGHTTTFDYDGGLRNKGYLTRVEAPPFSPGGPVRVSTFVVNADGSLQQQTDATGRITTYEYDGLGRLKRTNVGVVSGVPTYFESVAYDGNGNVVSRTDGEGRVTQYAYDENNRLITVTDALGGITRSSYYVSGARATLTNPNGRATTYSYDARNLLQTVADPMTHTTTYGYDSRGNRRSRLDANGVTTTYSYSLRNELTGILYPIPSNNVTYSYDRSGLRTQMADVTGTTTYQHDSLGRLTAVTSPVTGTLSYEYDALGNRTRLTYPNGFAVSYAYFPGGLLKSLDAPWWNLSSTVSYGYDDGGRLLTTNYPNQVWSTRSYDAAGRVQSVRHQYPTWQGPATITSHTYTYDRAGNRTRLEEQRYGAYGTAATSYQYDSLNRLVWVDYPSGGDTAYTYDAGGNRLQQQVGTGTTMYSYDAAERMVQINSNIIYEYDNNGNQVRRTESIYQFNSQYDVENRLTRTGAGCDVTEYRYNGDGLRVSTIPQGICGGRLDYSNDVNRSLPVVVMEQNTQIPPKLALYIYGVGLVAKVNQDRGLHYFYHQDGQGSVRALTDQYGVVLGTYGYDAFGQVQSAPSGVSNAYQYTGEPRDGESGYTYLRARYYDPSIGRFVSKDPFPGLAGDPQSQNPYAYAGNNPVNRSDPTGMCFIIGCLALAFGGSALAGAVAEGALLVASAVVGNAIGEAITGLWEHHTFEPGPKAGESVPATGPKVTNEQRDAVTEIGQQTGCHTCGAMDPGTASGKYIGDHQPVTALNEDGLPQSLYPHCKHCSATQGGETRVEKARRAELED